MSRTRTDADTDEPDRDCNEAGQVEPDSGQGSLRRKRPGEPRPREIGGPGGPEPTRYGDWERGGRCVDF